MRRAILRRGVTRLAAVAATATASLRERATVALSGVSANVTALLAKVVGVFNVSTLTLPPSAIASLPSAYQTLANPTLINPVAGATMSFLDLGIGSATASTTTESKLNRATV